MSYRKRLFDGYASCEKCSKPRTYVFRWLKYALLLVQFTAAQYCWSSMIIMMTTYQPNQLSLDQQKSYVVFTAQLKAT